MFKPSVDNGSYWSWIMLSIVYNIHVDSFHPIPDHFEISKLVLFKNRPPALPVLHPPAAARCLAASKRDLGSVVGWWPFGASSVVRLQVGWKHMKTGWNWETHYSLNGSVFYGRMGYHRKWADHRNIRWCCHQQTYRERRLDGECLRFPPQSGAKPTAWNVKTWTMAVKYATTALLPGCSMRLCAASLFLLGSAVQPLPQDASHATQLWWHRAMTKLTGNQEWKTHTCY